MDPACCNPGPAAREHHSVGKEVEIARLPTYLNWPTGSKQAVVLATDVFGWKRPLLRKLADKVAAAGFVAVVPDYFGGDFLPADAERSGADWSARHPVPGAAVDTSKVVKELKKMGIPSVGVVGFCYGGKVGVLVAQEGVLDATVIVHPGRVTVDDLKEVKGPLALLLGETDHFTPPALVEEYNQYLKSQNQIEYLVKVYPGVGHGWAVRYNENDESALNSAHEAHSDTINWFKKYLK